MGQPTATLGHYIPRELELNMSWCRGVGSPTPRECTHIEAQIDAEIEAGLTLDEEIRFDEDVLRSTYAEEYGPGAFEEIEKGTAVLCNLAMTLFARGYLRMSHLVGPTNAYHFASRYLQGEKPPSRGRGKKDPAGDAKRAAERDAAPRGRKKTIAKDGAETRRLQRDKKDRIAPQQAAIRAIADKWVPRKSDK
jgi:hypothetical protein